MSENTENTTPTRYEIKTLADFTKIPSDKIDACLADFKLWISLARTFQMSAIAPVSMDWIDDGKTEISEITISIKTGDK